MNPLRSGIMPGSGGVGISFAVDGPDGAPWLVLSNSLATDRRMWEPQVEAFCRSRRVLRYDARGHGSSEAVPGPYTFDQLTGDILALCDGLGIETMEFVGLSLGGMTGLALAMRAPDRVNKLVCCDARAYAPEPYRAMWDDNIARMRQAGVASLVEPTIGRWFTAEFSGALENADTVQLARTMIGNTSPQGYEGAARLLQSLDLRAGLESLESETLYIAGEADLAAPLDVMQEMASMTPNAKFTAIADAAHLSNLEQPAAFILAVREFLLF